MLFYIDRLIEIWLLPPGVNLLLMMIAFFLMRFWPKVGKTLLVLSFISLWLLSTPLVSQYLMDKLQYQYQALSPNKLIGDKNSAIVVLEAGVNLSTPEYEKPAVSARTLSRLRYAAFLHQKTGIPILVSGNDPSHISINQADVMADALKAYFNVPTQWKEDGGYSTAREAILSIKMLKKEGITKIYLVTDAMHMPRSVYAFQNKGMEIIPAPTSFLSYDYPLGTISAYLPTINTLSASSIVIREHIGIAWYYILSKLGHL